MADGRMLKRVITRSQKLAALKSDKARLLWFYMLPYTDVEGRIEADPLDIREDIIRRQRCGFTVEKVVACLNDLHRVGLIQVYEVNGSRYLRYTRFHDEQKIRRDREAESAIPAPLPEQGGRGPRKVKSSPSPSEGKLSKAKPSPSEGNEEIGIEEKSLEDRGLELEGRIQSKAIWFTDELAKKFHTISKDEATTFARITQHLSDLVRTLHAEIEIFDQALGWADVATSIGARSPKAVFVEKVKQETSFTGRGLLLKVDNG